MTPLEERNLRVCARYLDDGETAESLALDLGLSVMMIRVILKAGDALRKGRVRVIRLEADRVISPVHARIGAMLGYHRAFVRAVDRTSAAKELNWSVQRVAAVEKGTFNITLLDLQDLARFLETRVEELVNDRRTPRQVVLEHAPGIGENPGRLPAATTTTITLEAEDQIGDHSHHQEEATQ